MYCTPRIVTQLWSWHRGVRLCRYQSVVGQQWATTILVIVFIFQFDHFTRKKITLANRFNRKQYCIRVHNKWQRSVCKNCENAEKGTVLVKQILKKKNQRYFLGLLKKKFKIWLTWLKGQCREISGIFLCIKNSTWAPYEQPKRFGKIFHSRKNVCLRSA